MTGGSSFWLQAPAGVNTSELALELRKDSVIIEPGRAFFAPDAPDTAHFRMAYSSIPTNRIEDGVALVAARMRDMALGPAA